MNYELWTMEHNTKSIVFMNKQEKGGGEEEETTHFFKNVWMNRATTFLRSSYRSKKINTRFV